MFSPLRKFLFNKALRNLLNTQKRARRPHTLESARSIGVLFDATSETARNESLEFAKKLEKQGKKVSTLGFFNLKPAPENGLFDSFGAKEVSSWNGQPTSPKADAFAKQTFDVLLTLNPDELPALEWVAAQSQAAFKIGFATGRPNDFDIQLETPEGKGVRYFTEQLGHYLGKIVV